MASREKAASLMKESADEPEDREFPKPRNLTAAFVRINIMFTVITMAMYTVI